MAKKEASKGVSAPLKNAIGKLLKDVMDKDSTHSLTDKVKVIDRALKLAAIEAKLGDEGFGKAYATDHEENGED